MHGMLPGGLLFQTGIMIVKTLLGTISDFKRKNFAAQRYKAKEEMAAEKRGSIRAYA